MVHCLCCIVFISCMVCGTWYVMNSVWCMVSPRLDLVTIGTVL